MAFKLNLPKPNLGSAFSAFFNAIRFVLVKIVSVVLALVFLSLMILFIGYALNSVASTVRGRDAKVLLISDHIGKYRTAFRLGGLFMVTAQMDKKKYENIYCLYPSWPDNFQPIKGDVIRIWPVKQPLAGAPMVDGWEWFILGTLFIFGLVMLEFTILALMIS